MVTALWGQALTMLFLMLLALDPVREQNQGPEEKVVSKGAEELQDSIHIFLVQITPHDSE